ncbi:MAG: transglutaminase domain-containing protein [Anaerolineales bacterium]|nr:transglutaminase domain-containing protein [Anaerolineales bacterium]
MIGRILRVLLKAEAMSMMLMVVAVQILTYGVSVSLQDTDTNRFFAIGLAALVIGLGLGKAQVNGLRSSVLIAALGFTVTWILGARLAQPLLAFGSAVLSTFPDVYAALRYKQLIDTSAILETWKVVSEASLALLTRFQSWTIGLDQGLKVNDSLIRSMIWVLTLWLCSAWMGWFAKRRIAVTALLPSLVVLTLVTSYSEYKVESLWGLVVTLLMLMGVWNYRKHTQQWEKSRIDYSDSIRYDNSQAVLLVTIAIGALAFITPSVSWQDIVDTIREIRANQTAEMLGLQKPKPTGKPSNVQRPSLPRDHLLTGGFANSEKVVMTIKTGELPAVPYQAAITAPRYYWRSTVFDNYVGSGWVTSGVITQTVPAKTPLIPGLLNGYRVVHMNVEMTEAEGRIFWSGILFNADVPVSVNWRVKPPSDLFADQTALLQSDMFAAISQATAYQADVYVPTATAEQLRNAPDQYPPEIRDRYLVLPLSIPRRVRSLARDITNGISNPYDKAKAIEAYLRENYPYDLEVPGPPEGGDVADYFLFDLKRGYCDYYATTMVVLARYNGLPARFVSGYAPGYYDAPNAQYVVRELDAHSWVEIYFPGIGWVEFEPTASISEIDRAGGGTPQAEGQDTRRSALGLLTLFRFEKILTWIAPFAGVVILVLLYFILVERWLYLRLAPAITIDRIYQRFYRAGRPLAGQWIHAETSSEFLRKLSNTITELGTRSRFVRSFEKTIVNANLLTELYHSSLFVSHQTQKQDAHIAWQTWKRLRIQLFFTRLYMYSRQITKIIYKVQA